MSKNNQKQAGDRVIITAGAYKEKEGLLQEKVSKGWNVELETGEIVLVAFPFIKLMEQTEEDYQSEESQNTETSTEAETESAESGEITEEAVDETASLSEETVQESGDSEREDSSAQTEEEPEAEVEIPDDIKKMTVAQLRDLAKEKGVSVARTKEDFLRIIKEMNPDEDLERLKGKILFDRVSELHISRLRSKEDLQRLLAQK